MVFLKKQIEGTMAKLSDLSNLLDSLVKIWSKYLVSGAYNPHNYAFIKSPKKRIKKPPNHCG